MTPLNTIHLEAVGSTQDEARHRHGALPTLVVAGRQDAGRGRSGASWLTAPRAVAASLAFRCDWPAVSVPRLTLVAGLAATDVIPLDLKWPNDLVMPGGKVGGILTERFDDLVVIGMGLNLWWPDAPGGFAALESVDPGPGAGGRLADAWARRLLTRVESGPDRWGRDEYRSRCVTIGQEVTWEPAGSGTATDIASDGGLEVRTAAGTVVLTSGAVHTVRPAAGPPSLP